MTEREQRGLEIAARLRLTHTGARWRVPSQSKGVIYDVVTGGDKITCTCPDWELRLDHCKHIFAVLFVMQREGITADPEPQLVPEPAPEPEEPKPVRQTYPQDWRAYDRAQRTEKWEFMRLLSDLCQTIEQPKYKFGRPTLPLSDMVFGAGLKVYSTLSGRRFMGELDTALEKGYISQVPHFSTLFRYLEGTDLTPILGKLIGLSAAPLTVVETAFAADASGFSTSRFDRWYDEKYGRERSQQVWVKAHIMVGVKTNIITAAKVTDRDSHDSPHLPGLLTETGKRFTVKEVSADKGYLGEKNFAAIVDAGAVPFIPFKTNSTPNGSDLWNKLYATFMFNRDAWLPLYHKRSNVETAFSQMKAKFGDALRCKSDEGLVNEMLLKALCHNLCVLIQETQELGIDPSFGEGTGKSTANLLQFARGR